MNHKIKIINDLVKEIEKNIEKSQKLEPYKINERLNTNPKHNWVSNDENNDKKSNLVYTKSHFTWLFKQDSKHSLFKYFNNQNDKTKLEKLLDDLSESFKMISNDNNLDVNELHKLFLVNYEKGSSMHVPIKLEIIDDNNFINKYSTEMQRFSFDQFGNDRKITSLITERKFKFDSETNIKEEYYLNAEIYPGLKAFYNYYLSKTKGKTPYSFKLVK